MDRSTSPTDEAILGELGARLSAARLSRDLTQAQLAHEAGVSKRTVERLEAGRSAHLTSFIRILRTLGLVERFDLLLPPKEPEPMDLLRRAGATPQRARGTAARKDEPWSWADEG